MTRLVLLATLGVSTPAWSQGLPELAPLNPVSSSRSGLYFQPYRDPAPGKWVAVMGLDYASVIEYNERPQASYILDSELLRLSLGLSRDLGSRTFVTLGASLDGAYAGFMDGLLDWYHGALGIRMIERDRRPEDRFLYSIVLPDGSTVSRKPSNVFLQDVRAGLGLRHTPTTQSVLSLTLPTSTGPQGYGRGVVSLSILNTFRTELDSRVVYEGSLGFGFTPNHGRLPALQHETFVSASSGFRAHLGGRHSLFANLFYHSPYYHDTTLPSLDRRELSLDFGWILHTRQGPEWRIGMTEDLEPGGPGVDLVFRFGRTF
jgi:uncharacterized protein DUF3187